MLNPFAQTPSPAETNPYDFNFGKRLFRERSQLPTDGDACNINVSSGYFWQMGFEHAYDGVYAKSSDANYRSGYASGLQARQRYRD
jgi:hypothetical protein